MTKMLKLEEAKEFVKRGIFDKNVEVGIVNFRNEFFIDKIAELPNDVRFIVTSLDEACKCNVSYKQIIKIAGQSIEDVLEAYDMGSNKTIDVNMETDVVNDVIGKDEATIIGIKLDEGMRIILHKDKTEKMNNKILNVKYDNEGLIKLVGNRGRPKKNA